MYQLTFSFEEPTPRATTGELIIRVCPKHLAKLEEREVLWCPEGHASVKRTRKNVVQVWMLMHVETGMLLYARPEREDRVSDEEPLQWWEERTEKALWMVSLARGIER